MHVASVAGMGEAVLVVEHEEPTRAFLFQQLTDDGFEVYAADRATSALEDCVEAPAPPISSSSMRSCPTHPGFETL